VTVGLVRLKRIFDDQRIVDIKPCGAARTKQEPLLACWQLDVGMSPKDKRTGSIVDDAVWVVLLRHFDKGKLALCESLAWRRRHKVPCPVVRHTLEHFNQNFPLRNRRGGDISFWQIGLPASADALSR